MEVELVKEYRFEAAHRLPEVPADHKCARLHGHSFRFEVHVTGPVDDKLGWYIDYAALDEVVKPIVKQLDHYYLNELDGLANPTSENLARWLWQRIVGGLPGLTKIVVMETCNTRCIYRGR